MLHKEGFAVMHQTDHVKAARLFPGVVTAQPGLRRPADIGLLGGRQGVGGGAHAPGGPRLDFHKNQFPPVMGYHVQLNAPETPVPLQNAPAQPPRKGGGNLLAAPAQRRGPRPPGVLRRAQPFPQTAKHQNRLP